MAESLRIAHKLDGWRIQFDESRSRFGQCRIGEHVISLSRPLVELNNMEEVKDTILHEIAHALAPIGAHHNHAWKAVARSIGCRAERCYNAGSVITPPAKYNATCPACGRKIQRERKTTIACNVCCKGKFQAEYKFLWEKN